MGRQARNGPPVTTERAGSTHRYWAWAVMGLVLLLILGIGAAWVWRAPALAWLVKSQCADRGLVCRFDLEQVTLTSVSASGLAVSTESGQTPFATESLALKLDWDGLFSPRLTEIEMNAPRIEAAFDGETFSLYGLEEVFPSGGSGSPGAPWPKVLANAGALRLETPAGHLSGQFDLNLESRMQAVAQLRIDPAELDSGEGQLTLASGLVDLRIEAGIPSGVADLEISEGAFGQFFAQSVLLRAEFQPAVSTSTDILHYRLAARELGFNGYGVRAATSSGDVLLNLDEVGGESEMRTILAGLVGRFEADAVHAPGYGAEEVSLEVDLGQTAEDGIEGPVALTAGRLQRDDLISATDLVLTGAASLSETGEARFEGRATGKTIALASPWRDALASLVMPGAIPRGHAEALGKLVETALSDFDAGLTFSARRARNGNFAFRARGPIRLTAASGTQAALLPFGETAGLRWEDGTLTLRGAVSLEGGGGPKLVTNLNEFSRGPDGLVLNLANLTLSPWRQDNLVISAEIEDLDLRQTAGTLRASGRGTLGLDGQLGVAQLANLSLFGTVDALHGREGWRAQLGNGNCIGLETDGLMFQSVEIGEVRTRLCPPDGRLVRQGPDGPEGTLAVDTVILDVTSSASQGTLRLPSPNLSWTANGGLTADLTSNGVKLDLTTGPRELSILADRADIGLSLANGIQLSGGLNTARFGGSLIPAEVTAGSARFNITDTRGGLTGTGDLSRVRIADTRTDPVYQPVVADLSADLARGELHMTGPVYLARTNRHIADAELDLSFPSIDGLITVTSHDLDFRSGGLQISDLSERLRGYFTNTRGRIDAEVRVSIDSGQLGATGDVTVRDFGFQTVALGRISGVNGEVIFDDLLRLTTPPSQTVTIGAIDPGLPLTNGEVKFQMIGGGSARLESALWPFAGGVLAVQPTTWQVGATSRRLTVRADRIRLVQLTELLQMPGFSAEGTVSGRFPIEFVAGNVYVRDAHLAADAAGGTLRYTGDVGARAGATNETVAMAFEALKNFRFTVLEIGADGNLADDIVLSARLQGHNPDVLRGQDFNFNVSIDSKLGQLLSSTQKLTGTDWLAEIQAQQTERAGDE